MALTNWVLLTQTILCDITKILENIVGPQGLEPRTNGL